MDNYFGDIFNVSSPMLTNYLDIVHKKVVWNVKPKKEPENIPQASDKKYSRKFASRNCNIE